MCNGSVVTWRASTGSAAPRTTPLFGTEMGPLRTKRGSASFVEHVGDVVLPAPSSASQPRQRLLDREGRRLLVGENLDLDIPAELALLAVERLGEAERIPLQPPLRMAGVMRNPTVSMNTSSPRRRARHRQRQVEAPEGLAGIGAERGGGPGEAAFDLPHDGQDRHIASGIMLWTRENSTVPRLNKRSGGCCTPMVVKAGGRATRARRRSGPGG